MSIQGSDYFGNETALVSQVFKDKKLRQSLKYIFAPIMFLL